MTNVKRQRDEVQRLRDGYARATEKAMRFRDVDPQRYAAAFAEQQRVAKAIEKYAAKNNDNGGNDSSDQASVQTPTAAQALANSVTTRSPQAAPPPLPPRGSVQGGGGFVPTAQQIFDMNNADTSGGFTFTGQNGEKYSPSVDDLIRDALRNGNR